MFPVGVCDLQDPKVTFSQHYALGGAQQTLSVSIRTETPAQYRAVYPLTAGKSTAALGLNSHGQGWEAQPLRK